MRRVLNAVKWSLVPAIAAVMLWPQMTGAQPVLFRVQTDTGNDTLFYGDTGNIIFTVDPNGNEVAAFTFPLLIHFSNGNIIGVIRYGYELVFPPEFDDCVFCLTPHPSKGTDPDTLLWGWNNFQFFLDTASEVARIVFVPLDTGQIIFDTTFLLPANVLLAVDPMANSLPLEWDSPPITVVMPPCAVALTGDVDEDGLLTAMDIIAMVNYVFRSGSPPAPCHAAMDVNCDGIPERSGADILYTVNYVYKSGPPSCDVCPLIWNGTWECE